MTQFEVDTVDGLLGRPGESRAERIAVIDRDQAWSYGELTACVDRIAAQLTAMGVRPGDRVAVIVDKRVELVAAIFGCCRAGAALAPVNPQLKSRQVRHILSDSGARILIGSQKREPVLAEASDDLALGATLSPEGELSVLESGAQDLAPRRAPAPGFEDAPIATLFYTSGSTGMPKAVVCTHRNIIAGAESVSTYLENTESDVILAILPLSFDAGFSQLTTGFRVGATIILRDYLLPNDISRACADNAVTCITGVPAIWGAALRAKWTDPARENIRYFANTGGHLPHERINELMELFPNARPYPMYGLTEAFRSSYLHPDMVWKKKGSIGKAIPGATLLVVDEAGEECAPGVSGELVHVGPTVALGYWNNPTETAKRFRPAPMAAQRLGRAGMVVFSGDLARRDEDGFLFFEGRRDAQIKISGNRISFAEIEELALTHPKVRAAAAGGRKTSPDKDPDLVLFIETDGGAAIASEVSELLKADLPGFSVPSQIFARSQLALNANNKYDVPRMIAEQDNHHEQGRPDGAD